jgi:hypothetical protein
MSDTTSGFRLPRALDRPDDDQALAYLRAYYAPELRYTGSAFDTWDSTDTRHADRDRFTADDIVAVKLLSIDVPARAAHSLLATRAEKFSDLLHELGPDRDLVNEPPIDSTYVGWKIMGALRDLDGVGATTASKLLARKRPRLRPIWDSVVTKVTNTHDNQWEPVRAALDQETPGGMRLHDRLVRLHSEAALDSAVSPLRILDVIAWMEGTAPS